MKRIRSIKELKQIFPQGWTKGELAEYYGLTNYDTALPQTLYDKLSEDGFDPYGQYVFDYTYFNFGIIFPLTSEAIAQHEKKLGPFKDPRKQGLSITYCGGSETLRQMPENYLLGIKHEENWLICPDKSAEIDIIISVFKTTFPYEARYLTGEEIAEKAMDLYKKESL